MTEFEIAYPMKNGEIKKVLVQSDATTLDLTELSQIDLSFARRLPNLKDLRLMGSLSSVDLTPLQQCLQLERLVLSKNGLEGIDLSPLRRCPNLREVHINGNNLSKINLAPLSLCPQLSIFKVSGNKLTEINLHPLAQCSKLSHLHIEGNKLVSVDLSPLAQCPNLQSLYLSGNPLPTVNIGALCELPYLRVMTNSTTAVQHGGDWKTSRISKAGNIVTWVPRKEKPKKKEAVPVPKMKEKPKKKEAVPVPKMKKKPKKKKADDSAVTITEREAEEGLDENHPKVRRIREILFGGGYVRVRTVENKLSEVIDVLKDLLQMDFRIEVKATYRRSADFHGIPKKKAKKEFDRETSPDSSREFASRGRFRIWWDYENMGMSMKVLDLFIQRLARVAEIDSSSTAAAQWSRYRGQERILRNLGFLTLAVESEEKDAADIDLQTLMQSTRATANVIDIVLTHDSGTDWLATFKEMKEQGKRIWLITRKDPPKKLVKAADWHSAMDKTPDKLRIPSWDFLVSDPSERRVGSGRLPEPYQQEISRRIASRLSTGIPEVDTHLASAIETSRVHEIKGGKVILKVKVRNTAEFNIATVNVSVVDHPEECLELLTSPVRKRAKMGPGGVWAPSFEFAPTKDCVEGLMHSTVTYFDHRNQPNTVHVEKYRIRLICAMLKPVVIDVQKLTLMIEGMSKDTKEVVVYKNAEILYSALESLLPSMNYHIVESESKVSNSQFFGKVSCFAEGKIKRKKIANILTIVGMIDGIKSKILIDTRGEDVGMIPSVMSEFISTLEGLQDTLHLILYLVDKLMVAAGESSENIENVRRFIESQIVKDHARSVVVLKLLTLATDKISSIQSNQLTSDDLEDIYYGMEQIAKELGMRKPIRSKLKGAAVAVTTEGVKVGAVNVVWTLVRAGAHAMGIPLP